MKHKLLLLAFVLLLAVTAQAQTYDSLFHPNGRYQMDIRNMMELRDGGIVANVQLFNCDTMGSYESDYGCRLYKAVRDENGITVTDSLTIEDSDMNYFLLEKNPFDDDNIFAKIERNFDSCRSELVIRFFDDNMNIEPEKEVRVEVADTLQSPLFDSYMLDPEGNILAYFYIRSRKESHFLRADIEGNVIDHVVLSQPDNPVKGLPTWGMFNDSPRQYCLYGNGGNHLSILVLDSLLNPIKSIVPCDLPTNYELLYDELVDRMMVWDDSTFWLCSKYSYTAVDPEPGFIDPLESARGVLIGRFSKSDAKAITIKLITRAQIPYGDCAYSIGLSKTNDGCAIFSYYGGTSSIEEPIGYGSEYVVMKLDSDLKTNWEQHCLRGYADMGHQIVLTQDNDIAIVGQYSVQEIVSTSYTAFVESEVVFLFFDDNNFSTPEQEKEHFPYVVYPNPATDVINLSLLTDAEPSLIELYDIQGRMVRSQENNFERISLHGLPVGTYALRVSMKDGKSYTSAVVKK